MNAPELILEHEEGVTKAAGLLGYYEAIEQASQDMLEAARCGDWDRVMRLEGACAVLIAKLKHAANERPLQTEEAMLKGRIMQRILVNDAEIRNLAEPWINEISRMGSHPESDSLH
jgi:flagellar protein FliT